MKSYVGCKIIQAEEMDLDTYNATFGKVVPAPEHTSKDGYHVRYPDGYNSWSPKAVFEMAYRPLADNERAII